MNAPIHCLAKGGNAEHTNAALQDTFASYGVVESPADQPWAVFCATLKRPAFLLAESGFGELEQT